MIAAMSVNDSGCGSIARDGSSAVQDEVALTLDRLDKGSGTQLGDWKSMYL